MHCHIVALRAVSLSRHTDLFLTVSLRQFYTPTESKSLLVVPGHLVPIKWTLPGKKCCPPCMRGRNAALEPRLLPAPPASGSLLSLLRGSTCPAVHDTWARSHQSFDFLCCCSPDNENSCWPGGAWLSFSLPRLSLQGSFWSQVDRSRPSCPQAAPRHVPVPWG